MSEQAVASGQACVLVYSGDEKKWVAQGPASGLSKVTLYHNPDTNTYRVVGRNLQDKSVVVNSNILRNTTYNKATDAFHQWRDARGVVYGLNFSSKEGAASFAAEVETAIKTLNNPDATRAQMAPPPQRPPPKAPPTHSAPTSTPPGPPPSGPPPTVPPSGPPSGLPPSVPPSGPPPSTTPPPGPPPTTTPPPAGPPPTSVPPKGPPPPGPPPSKPPPAGPPPTVPPAMPASTAVPPPKRERVLSTVGTPQPTQPAVQASIPPPPAPPAAPPPPPSSNSSTGMSKSSSQSSLADQLKRVQLKTSTSSPVEKSPTPKPTFDINNELRGALKARKQAQQQHGQPETTPDVPKQPSPEPKPAPVQMPVPKPKAKVPPATAKKAVPTPAKRLTEETSSDTSSMVDSITQPEQGNVVTREDFIKFTEEIRQELRQQLEQMKTEIINALKTELLGHGSSNV
eukprot:m.111369 g.111369  ORF g.111369 m.111369 type:complete len:455 (+) comp15295_c1_seq1:222-1586(+)